MAGRWQLKRACSVCIVVHAKGMLQQKGKQVKKCPSKYGNRLLEIGQLIKRSIETVGTRWNMTFVIPLSQII